MALGQFGGILGQEAHRSLRFRVRAVWLALVQLGGNSGQEARRSLRFRVLAFSAFCLGFGQRDVDLKRYAGRRVGGGTTFQIP